MPAGAPDLAVVGIEAGDLHIYGDCQEEEGDGGYYEFCGVHEGLQVKKR